MEYGKEGTRAGGQEGWRERQARGSAKVQIGAELLCKSGATESQREALEAERLGGSEAQRLGGSDHTRVSSMEYRQRRWATVAVQKWGPNFRSRVSAVGSQVQVFGFGYRFRI